MYAIDTQGTGIILPAILIGFGGPDFSIIDRAEQADLPDWIVGLSMQIGGHLTGLANFAGVVLRLSDNVARCKREPGELLRCLRLMGEDPDYGKLAAEFPGMDLLAGTSGKEYDAIELRRIRNHIQPYFDIPPFVDGIEAFLDFGTPDPLKYFENWSVCTIRKKDATITYFDESNLDMLEIHCGEHFTPAMLERLYQLRFDLGTQREVETYFAWENSD